MSPPSVPSPAGLDLAFSLSQALPPGLATAAGALADPERAEACWHGHLLRWLAALAGELPESLRAPAYSIGLELIDDSAMARLNEAWRGVPRSTDVLAFAAQEPLDPNAPPLPSPPAAAGIPPPLELGDVLISLETAARQAPDHGHDLPQELLFLASHGLLHLLGWDHPDEATLAAMLERQRRLIEDGPPDEEDPRPAGAAC